MNVGHQIKSVAIVVEGIINRVVNIFTLIFYKRYYCAESYYPEYKDRKKSIFHILFDQYVNIIKYGKPNDYYYLYGFDISGLKNICEFVDNTEFRNRRELLNRKVDSAIAVLRDKSLFSMAANSFGIATPKELGILTNGISFFVYDRKVKIPFQDVVSNYSNEYFLKKTNGECADGVWHIFLKDGLLYEGNKQFPASEWPSLFPGRWVLQERIIQHHDMNAIFDKSINTIRLVTIYNYQNTSVEVISAVLRIGTKNNTVDNWAMGGLSVGIDLETGTLRQYGYYKPGFGTKVLIHPDSRVQFEGYKIPFFEEAVQQAINFHGQISDIHSIGWDIAITPSGPCFIEGNDNWEISLMQASNMGLRREFDSFFN